MSVFQLSVYAWHWTHSFSGKRLRFSSYSASQAHIHFVWRHKHSLFGWQAKYKWRLAEDRHQCKNCKRIYLFDLQHPLAHNYTWNHTNNWNRIQKQRHSIFLQSVKWLNITKYKIDIGQDASKIVVHFVFIWNRLVVASVFIERPWRKRISFASEPCKGFGFVAFHKKYSFLLNPSKCLQM